MDLGWADKRFFFLSSQLPNGLVQEQVAFEKSACLIHLLNNNHDINQMSFMDNKRGNQRFSENEWFHGNAIIKQIAAEYEITALES